MNDATCSMNEQKWTIPERQVSQRHRATSDEWDTARCTRSVVCAREAAPAMVGWRVVVSGRRAVASAAFRADVRMSIASDAKQSSAAEAHRRAGVGGAVRDL